MPFLFFIKNSKCYIAIPTIVMSRIRNPRDDKKNPSDVAGTAVGLDFGTMDRLLEASSVGEFVVGR